jgi:hypothetical protein
MDSLARRSRRQAAATVAAMAVALTACAGSDGSPDAADVPGTTTATADPVTPVGPEDAVRTVIIGDEGTDGSGSGNGWPDLLAAQLESVGVPMSIATSATPGSGFATDPLFLTAVEAQSVGSTQLVILYDSSIGEADAASLSQAAEKTFSAAERSSPDARVIVVGPLGEGASRSGASAEVDDALRSAAEEAGATYVDPVAESWPADPSQEEVAALLMPHIEPLAAALAASGANR